MALKRKIEIGDKATERAVPMWLIWSVEHNAWWAPNGRGYRSFVEKAGRFTFREALDIVMDANQAARGIPMEVMCPDYKHEVDTNKS